MDRCVSFLFSRKIYKYSGFRKKCFLKVIVKGYLTYYKWEFKEQESDYIWSKSLYKRKDEHSLVRVTQGILGLKKKSLAVYFQDCPELVYKIENGELKDPVEIAKFYNKWKVYNPKSNNFNNKYD